MGQVIPFRKASLAERVARQYGFQIHRHVAGDNAEAASACDWLGQGYVYRCYDPNGSYKTTGYCVDAQNAWECACFEVWVDRFIARHGQAMHDRYWRHDGGFSPPAELAA